MNQEERILQYIDDFGSITALDAVRDLGVMQLSARICGLEKKGFVFPRETETGINRYGEQIRFTRYRRETA